MAARLLDAALRAAGPADAEGVANVLIASRLAYLPFAPSAHSPDDVRAWVWKRLIPEHDVAVADAGGTIVGVLATAQQDGAAWIEQLYVLPGWTGRGIGSRLLGHAHDGLPRPIRLWTFQANAGARRFYERHGYRAIAFTDDRENEERCPDVLYELAAGA
jgi:GNAT superfamily N-acetyltransferase